MRQHPYSNSYKRGFKVYIYCPSYTLAFPSLSQINQLSMHICCPRTLNLIIAFQFRHTFLPSPSLKGLSSPSLKELIDCFANMSLVGFESYPLM